MATKTAKELTFSFETIEELCDMLFDESGETRAARVTYENGEIILIAARLRDVDVQVYKVKDSPELYEKMDDKYVEVLENMTSGSDFYDKWHALIETLEQYKLVDEVLNP